MKTIKLVGLGLALLLLIAVIFWQHIVVSVGMHSITQQCGGACEQRIQSLPENIETPLLETFSIQGITFSTPFTVATSSRTEESLFVRSSLDEQARIIGAYPDIEFTPYYSLGKELSFFEQKIAERISAVLEDIQSQELLESVLHVTYDDINHFAPIEEKMRQFVLLDHKSLLFAGDAEFYKFTSTSGDLTGYIINHADSPVSNLYVFNNTNDQNAELQLNRMTLDEMVAVAESLSFAVE